MPRNNTMTRQNKSKDLTKVNDVNMTKISAFFRRSTLRSIMKILTMEHGGFRTFKTVKNINRLFSNIDMTKYKNSPELESYIWCISYMSKQWLDGVIDPELISEGAKLNPEYDEAKEKIFTSCIDDKNIVTPPEAKVVFDLVTDALQFGYVASMKDEYLSLLDEIDMSQPKAYHELVNRLFSISSSLMDIKHSTNLVANKITFNTSEPDSIKASLSHTIQSLKGSNNVFKTGIQRLNTLLSPGYMNGRLYVYLGLPASGKSLMLLKSALDIRKYNPGFIPKTPGMKPCVLYITMENTFIETIERVWNMTFDEPISNYSEEEATSMLSDALGIGKIYDDDRVVHESNDLLSELENRESVNNSKEPNIEIVLKYFSYREISTDDIFTIVQDLRDENMEVCAIVMDYIKRIRPATPAADNVKLELNRVINECKAQAVMLDVPYITAHQMNRSAATAVDTASRQGKGDVTKLVGRDNVGDAWEVVEAADWLAVLNIEYKPGTNEKYSVISVVKRRRIESGDSEMSKYTYLAHPFSRENGLRLIDDLYLNKVLSLQSLSTDIEALNTEKTNAVPRLKTMTQSEFVEFDDD